MSQPHQPASHAHTGESDVLTLTDVCKACAVQSDFLLELLEEGVIEPAQGQAPESWRFTEVQLHHVSVAWRLQRDLGVNPAGAALVLQLMEEVQTLRAQLGQPVETADTN